MKKINLNIKHNWLGPLALTLFLLLFVSVVHAQVRITGRVTDSATSKPIPDASVYIANSTIGTKTDQNGAYSFSNLTAGNYEIFASFVGYQTKQAVLTTVPGDNVVNLSLHTHTVELKEVTISTNKDWVKNLALFKNEFIGTSNAQECKIINPEMLNLAFNTKKNLLTANTDDFLEIENSKLGYKLRFFIKDFWANYNTGRCHYSGSVLFEEMHGTASEQKKWIKNRLNAYNGSFSHFLVALANNRLNKEKYVLHTLYRSPNPAWIADSIKQSQNKKTAEPANVRTYTYTPLKTIETLDKKTLTEADLVKPGSEPGIFELRFPGLVYVIYKNKTIGNELTDDLHRQYEAYDYEIAAMSLKNPTKPVLFSANGILITHEAVLFEGAWDSRIVDLLPFDYMPEKK